jgi:hypothetical protein
LLLLKFFRKSQESYEQQYVKLCKRKTKNRFKVKGSLAGDPYFTRLVGAGFCTLQELDQHWTLEDCVEYHEYLDIQEDAEAYNYLEREKRNK